MRKWILFIIIPAFGFLFLLIVGIQIFLLTDMPRQWVIQRISKKFGIETSIDSLSTSWSGTTKIKNVRLSLPIEESTFLIAPEITLSHNNIGSILLKRGVIYDSIRINKPVLTIQKGKAGRWNIHDIISTIGNSKDNARISQRKWPYMDIKNATILIVDPNKQITKISSLNFHGETASFFNWRFEMNVASKVNINGQIVPQKMSTHNVNFVIKDMNEFLQGWIPNDISPTTMSGQWNGQLDRKRLTGKLRLDRLEIGTSAVIGDAVVKFERNEIIFYPDNMQVCDEKLPTKKVKILSGSISLQPDKIQAKELMVGTGGFLGHLDGSWIWELGKGEFSGSWEGAVDKKNIRHEGIYNVSLNWPEIGRRQIDAEIFTKGLTPFGNWQAHTQIIGVGQEWSSSQWKMVIPDILWRQEDKDFKLEGLRGQFTIDWPEIRLVSLNAANVDKLNARGNFLASDLSWAIELKADNVQIKGSGEPTVDIKLTAEGSRQGITISDSQLKHQDKIFSSSGKITLPTAKLENVGVSVQGRIEQQDNTASESTKIAGRWRIDSDIEGTAWPMNLNVHSTFTGENFSIGKQTAMNFKVPFNAKLNKSSFLFETEPFELLEGLWQLNGRYELSNQSSEANLNIQNLALKTAAQIIDCPIQCHGFISANLNINLLGFEMNRFRAFGSWSANEIKIPPLEAEKAEGKLSLYNGIVKFDPVILRQGQGLVQAALQFSLRQPQKLQIEVVTKKWPFALSNYSLSLSTDCNARLNLDVLERRARGSGSLSTEVLLKEKDFGDLNFEALIQERTIKLSDIQMRGLGGDIEGTVKIELDEWTTSNAELIWQDIELSTFCDLWPQLKGLSGKSSGNIKANRSEETRSLEPIRIEADLKTTDGNYRNAEFGNCQIVAYAGKKRFLIEQSMFELMGGKLQTRASLSRHAKELFARVHTNFEQLDLNQLIRIFHPEANPVSGRLGGQGIIITSSDLRRLSGEAELGLTESDLINNSVIGTLYDALNLNFERQHQPKGQGWMKLQVNGSTLRIHSFYYFNRGVEIRGAGIIENLTLGAASPVQGYAIGLTRPLKELSLPGVKELDKLMTSLQTGASSVKVQGTLSKPEVTIVPFPQIRGELRHLLWEQLRK